VPRTTKQPAPAPPPDLSEQTPAQTTLGSNLLWGTSLLYGAGGCAGNPLGFPYYADGYPRNYHTYRWMLCHPIIQQARYAALARALAAEPDYRKTDDTAPDSRIELLRRNFGPLWKGLLRDGLLRGRDYGWAGFEPVWDSAGGEWRIVALKPLAWDRTQIIADDAGAFAGLGQGNLRGGMKVTASNGQDIEGLPAPFKAWLYTHDREAGGLYGKPWLENIRETAWKEDLDCAQQLQKLSSKVAGVQAIGMSPAKSKASIEAAIKGLVNGAPGAWLETFPFSIPQDKLTANPDLWKIIFELAKSPLQSITPLDFGSTTPAIIGLLDRRRHAQEMMFAGALLSPRVGMEGKHGTKAEAQTHTDSGVTIAELYLDDFAEQLQPLVDAVLILNDGPGAKGTCCIDPPPLQDTKSEYQKYWLDKCTTQTPVGAAMGKITDMVKIAKDWEVPTLDGVKFEIADVPAPDPNAPPAMNGQNGNGKQLSPRVAKAGRRIFGANGN
jgi:hypothetical protein